MNTKNEPCSICEKYMDGVACDEHECPVAIMKAEIERYKSVLPYLEHQNMDFCGVLCDFAEELIDKAKVEAIEEFAERVKDAVDEPKEIDGEVIDFIIDIINSLVKEMTEDKDVQN